MGATRWQTIRQVVLPEAMPGILTGTIPRARAGHRRDGAATDDRRGGVGPSGAQRLFDTSSMMPRQIYSWSSELEPAFRHGVLAAGVIPPGGAAGDERDGDSHPQQVSATGLIHDTRRDNERREHGHLTDRERRRYVVGPVRRPVVDNAIDVEGSTGPADADRDESVIESRNLDVFYGDVQALQSIDIEIPERQVTAMIGPSGCGSRRSCGVSTA